MVGNKKLGWTQSLGRRTSLEFDACFRWADASMEPKRRREKLQMDQDFLDCGRLKIDFSARRADPVDGPTVVLGLARLNGQAKPGERVLFMVLAWLGEKFLESRSGARVCT